MQTMRWTLFPLMCCLPRLHAQYELANEGARCPEGMGIDAFDDCLFAAQSMGLPAVAAERTGSGRKHLAPAGCYWKEKSCCGGLWLNPFESTATGKRIKARGICKRPLTTTTSSSPPSVFYLLHGDAQQDSGLIEDATEAYNGTMVFKNISRGIVGAINLIPSMATNSSGIFHWVVAVPSTDASIQVPVSAVSGLVDEQNPVVLRVSVIRPGELSSIDAKELDDHSKDLSFEGVVSVDLFSLSQPGRPLKVENLLQPILVHIPVNMSRSMDAVCAFFDINEGRWSRRGVTRVFSRTEFVCAVHHLSIFGAVIGLLENALNCGTVSILSEEGISSMNKEDWWFHPASLWSAWVFFLHVAIIVVCTFLDRRTAGEWKDEWFIAVQPEVADQHNKFSVLNIMLEPLGRFKELVHVIRQRSLTSKVAVSFCVRLTEIVTAAYGGVQLDQFNTPKKRNELQNLESVYRRLRELILHHHRTLFSEKAGLCATFCLFLRVLHPWLGMSLQSIQLPRSTRALMLMAGVVAAMFTSALLFVSGSPPQSRDSPRDCFPDNIWDQIGQTVAVSIISGLLASVPLLAFASLHGQGVRVIHDPSNIRSVLRSWRLRDRVLWLLCSVYILLCFTYVVVYGANVSHQDQVKWVLNSAMRIFQQTVLMPCAFTAGFCFLSRSFAMFPAVVDESREQLERMFALDANSVSVEGESQENALVESVDHWPDESGAETHPGLIVTLEASTRVVIVALWGDAALGQLPNNSALEGALIRALATKCGIDMTGASILFEPCDACSEGTMMKASSRRVGSHFAQETGDPTVMVDLSALLKKELKLVDALEGESIQVLRIQEYFLPVECQPGIVPHSITINLGGRTTHGEKGESRVLRHLSHALPDLTSAVVACDCTMDSPLNGHCSASNALSKTGVKLLRTI